MKKIVTTLILTALIVITTSCGIFHKNQGVIGKASIAEDKAKQKIELVDTTSAKVNVERLDRIGEYSYGIKYSLDQTNDVGPVLQLNKRIMSLSNQPTLDAIKDMEAIVDSLLTNNNVILLKKDKEITTLLNDVSILKEQKQTAIDNYIKLANQTAALSDQYKATLNQMDSWLGLGAIWYGIKRFVTSSLWILGIGGILFLVLRLASLSNPIAASIFSIFNRIGSWFVNIISVIVPKAVEMAGHTATSVFNAYKSTLRKIVDGVEMAKANAAASGKTATIEDALNEVEKSMNAEEKDIVEELKKSLNWKPTPTISPSIPTVNLLNA